MKPRTMRNASVAYAPVKVGSYPSKGVRRFGSPVNAFLTVGLFKPLGQAHDELKSEFIEATTASASQRWIGHSTTFTEPCTPLQQVFPWEKEDDLRTDDLSR